MIRTRDHGRPIILHVTGRGKERIRKSITGDRETQVKLARRSVLENELRSLGSQRSILEQTITNLEQIEETDRKRFAIESFGWLSNAEIDACCFPKSSDTWELGPYEKLNYRPEELRHITSRGLRVRSKSELLIAEALYRYDLPFRYEQVYRAGSVSISADLTIRRADGKVFIWEHEGLINKRVYVEWQRKKAELYASVGFYPWDNLIVTYDTGDGNIDLRIVESEIRNKLMI
ncbi:MAG: hypothetical protein IKI73_04720 [Firmicutes bacterium]|nr:hypothetical protein [Bacillota bacterium]